MTETDTIIETGENSSKPRISTIDDRKKQSKIEQYFT